MKAIFIINFSRHGSVFFTHIQSVTKVVKTYMPDGTKKTAANIYKATYSTQQVNNLWELDTYLHRLTQNDCISLGITKTTSGDLVTNKALSDEATTGTNLVSRSKKFFHWLNTLYQVGLEYQEHSLYLFDIDYDKNSPSHYKLSTAEEVREALLRLAPFLEQVQMLIRPSSSSNITNTETGECRNATKSFHVYIVVYGATNDTIFNWNEYLKRRCFAKDFAYVTSNGVGVTTKYLLDFAVPSPERLIVESLPVTYFPYKKELEPSIIYDGGVLNLEAIDFTVEPDYKEFVEAEKLKFKGVSTNTKLTKPKAVKTGPTSLTPVQAEGNTNIYVTQEELNNIEKLYKFFRQDMKFYDLKKIKEYLDAKLTKLILKFLGYSVESNGMFKMRLDEKTASASVREPDGLIYDFGSQWCGDIVNFIMKVHDLDFSTAWKYTQNLFGKNYKINKKIGMLPNPKDFEQLINTNLIIKL